MWKTVYLFMGAGTSWWKRALGIPVDHATSQPIQNVRRTVKQHIKTHPKFPSTIEKTKVGLREEWDRLQPSEFNE
jgi:hypothetical protein